MLLFGVSQNGGGAMLALETVGEENVDDAGAVVVVLETTGLVEAGLDDAGVLALFPISRAAMFAILAAPSLGPAAATVAIFISLWPINCASRVKSQLNWIQASSVSC